MYDHKGVCIYMERDRERERHIRDIFHLYPILTGYIFTSCCPISPLPAYSTAAP